MEAPKHIVEALQRIRSGLEIRWNPTAVLIEKGGYDAAGKIINPKFDPRFELWDTDPHGQTYLVMRLQNEDESFRPPGEWLVTHIDRFNPEKYGGSLEKMLDVIEAEAQQMQDIAEKDFDDLAGAVARWCADLRTIKSAAALNFRGTRKFAPGIQ